MKCKLCEQETWSSTEYCPKHDLSFREGNMTDLHVTNNDGPEAWLPVIEEIKKTWDGPFQTSFVLMVDGKPKMHIASNFIVELLELYIKINTKQ